MNITIDLEHMKKSSLLWNEYFIAQLVFEGKLQSGIDIEISQLQLSLILKFLEQEGYIKILDIETFDVEPREPLLALFKTTSVNKEVIEVLSYFNIQMKAKNPNLKGININSSANQKFIKGRLSEGYTVQDLKDVIDVMIKEWWGTKMQDYLRIETLFNATKFQSYINKVGTSDSSTFNPVQMC